MLTVLEACGWEILLVGAGASSLGEGTLVIEGVLLVLRSWAGEFGELAFLKLLLLLTGGA